LRKLFPDLGETLRELDALSLEQVGQVGEDPLAGLGPEICLVHLRADTDPEHHVEPLRPGQLRLALWAPDAVLLQELVVFLV
jgi:hypothetical protein